MRKPTRGEIKYGLKLKRLGGYCSSEVERFYVTGTKNGWAFFSDGEGADIGYICSERSRYFVDEENNNEN